MNRSILKVPLIIWGLISHSSLGLSQWPIVQSSSEATLEFEVFQKVHSAFEPYIQYFDKKNQNHFSDELITLYEFAKNHLERQNFSEANDILKQIITQKLKRDWNSSMREIFFLSHIHLSEHSESQKKSRTHLVQALFILPNWKKYDFNLSPRIRNSLDSLYLEENRKAITISTAKWIHDFPFIFLNGVKYDLKKVNSIKLLQGLHRVTFVSPKFQPITKILRAHEIPTTHLLTRPFVSGNCAKPILQVANPPANLAFFFSKNCIKRFDGKTWVTYEPKTKTWLKSLELPNFLAASAKPLAKKKKSYKNWWIWAAIGAVAISTQIEGPLSQTQKTTVYRRHR